MNEAKKKDSSLFKARERAALSVYIFFLLTGVGGGKIHFTVEKVVSENVRQAKKCSCRVELGNMGKMYSSIFPIAGI
jgi:hypothetical protein